MSMWTWRPFALVVAGVLLGALVHGVRPAGLQVRGFAAPTECEGGATVSVLPASEVQQLCGRSDVLVADARSAARFAEGHVAGAVHLPCDASGDIADAAYARLSGARALVVYGEGTDDAMAVAKTLSARLASHTPTGNLLTVGVLAGGFNGWEHAGLACASGPCDECTSSSR